MIRLDFPTTNNEAKYETLVAGLDLVKATGATSVVIYCDSQVITNQVKLMTKTRGQKNPFSGACIRMDHLMAGREGRCSIIVT